MKAKTKLTIRRVARNSSWEGANAGLWGRSSQLPEANGGLEAKPPASRGWGLPPAAGSKEAKLPAFGDFYDFSAK